MDICEKIAYIKGLAEGLGLDEATKEGKVLTAIIDLLSDITEEICDIEDGCDELMEQIDAVDEDLSALEDIIYEDDDCDSTVIAIVIVMIVAIAMTRFTKLNVPLATTLSI